MGLKPINETKLKTFLNTLSYNVFGSQTYLIRPLLGLLKTWNNRQVCSEPLIPCSVEVQNFLALK